MGTQVKSHNLNSRIEFDHPWFFQNDTLQRLIFCTEKNSTWKDEKVIYGIKDGQHIAYRLERIYLDNCPIGSKEIPIGALTEFTGILRVCSLDYNLIYELYYWEDELIEIKDHSNTGNTKSAQLHFDIDEVVVYGEYSDNKSGGNTNIWFLQNNSEYNLKPTRPRREDDKREGSSGNSTSTSSQTTSEKVNLLMYQFEMNEKLDCIRALLEQNSVFKDVLSKFYSGKTNLNLIWKIDHLGSDPKDKNGITITDTGVQSDITIFINSDKISNRSTIEVARTMLHEAIHAELWRRVKEIGGYSKLEVNSNQDEFATLWTYYNKYGHEKWQHELMAKDYVCTIASGLEQFFRQNNDTRFYNYCSDIDGFDMNTYIEALAWVGIKRKKEVRRDAWKNLSSEKQQKILKHEEYFNLGTKDCK